MICRTIAIKTCVVRWLREGFKLILQSDKAHESAVGDSFSEFAFIILHWQWEPVVT